MLSTHRRIAPTNEPHALLHRHLDFHQRDHLLHGTRLRHILQPRCETILRPRSSRAALALLKASLFLQLFLNGALLCTIVGLHFSREVSTTHRRKVLLLLFVLTTLVCMRNVFCTVQAFAASGSSIWIHEAYFWVFEGVAMLVFTGLFHVMHPAKYIEMGAESGCGEAGQTEPTGEED